MTLLAKAHRTIMAALMIPSRTAQDRCALTASMRRPPAAPHSAMMKTSATPLSE